MKKTHELFGNKAPILSNHCFKRYAERIYNVANDKSESWIKDPNNRIKVIKDLHDRLSKMTLIKNNIISDYHFNKYGKDINFLQHNNYIFVVRQYKIIVTVFKKEHLKWKEN